MSSPAGEPRPRGAANAYEVHPSAIVDLPCHIGRGTRIWHFTHVMAGAEIGADCVLGQNVFVGRRVRIGDRVKVQNNVSVYEGVTLDDEVFCGPSVVFTNVVNPRSALPRMDELRETRVGRGATLGANCTIVCGVTIGAHAFVGAGAVVTRDVPAHALVIGNPARRSGWMCACGHKLAQHDGVWLCPACGVRHRTDGHGLCAIEAP